MSENERLLLIAKIFDLIKDVVRATVYVALFYFIYLSVGELAGKQTQANISVAAQYIVSRDNSYGLPWIIMLIALAYARMEKTLRKTKTKEMQSHIRQLELRLDPHRTSSGLTPRGDTHPKDEVL